MIPYPTRKRNSRQNGLSLGCGGRMQLIDSISQWQHIVSPSAAVASSRSKQIEMEILLVSLCCRLMGHFVYRFVSRRRHGETAFSFCDHRSVLVKSCYMTEFIVSQKHSSTCFIMSPEVMKTAYFKLDIGWEYGWPYSQMQTISNR
jgi:hypothetical protein